MAPSPAEHTRVQAGVDALLRSRLLRALAAPREVDDYLQLFDPAWSTHEVRARVTDVRAELGGAVSLWLAPNRHFRGFRAGQFVQLTVERGAVRHTRCYSLCSAPSDGGPLRLSIRLLPGGQISQWASSSARVGDLVVLSQAAGDFVLPDALPPQLLLLSAGSGVTPVVSMVRELAHRPHRSRVTWLHYGRRETMLQDEIRALSAAHPWLSLVLTRTDGPDAAPAELRHLGPQALELHAPTWRQSKAFACGPAPMLEAARTLWKAEGIEHRLHTESFGNAWPSAPVDHTALRSRLVFEKSGREIRAVAGRSLLEQAEAAGLRPAYGCRMGICHTCTCRKISGAVRDARTGVISDRPGEEIQLCVSMPRSDVTLDL